MQLPREVEFFSIIEQRYNEQHSSGSSGRVREEERKMKSMGPLLIAILFITYFYRGGHDPSAPPRSATVNNKINAQVPGQGHTKFKVTPIHTVVIEVIS